MIERDDRHADAVRDFLAVAECYRMEGEVLRERGFHPQRIVGSDVLVWRSPSGQLYTTQAAIEATTEPEIIPEHNEQKEDE